MTKQKREDYRRYVIIESKTKGARDMFEDILPKGTTETEAIEKAKDSWGFLCKSDKETTTIELAHIELDEDGNVDYGTGYTPIWSSEDIQD